MFTKQLLTATLLFATAQTYTKVNEITPATYDHEIKQSSGLVVLDLYATWCGPCKNMAPIFEEVSNEFLGKVKFVKMDLDKSKDIAASLGIQVVPTFFIFKDGSLVKKVEGSLSKEKLKNTIQSYL